MGETRKAMLVRREVSGTKVRACTMGCGVGRSDSMVGLGMEWGGGRRSGYALGTTGEGVAKEEEKYMY